MAEKISEYFAKATGTFEPGPNPNPAPAAEPAQAAPASAAAPVTAAPAASAALAVAPGDAGVTPAGMKGDLATRASVLGRRVSGAQVARPGNEADELGYIAPKKRTAARTLLG